MIITYGYIMILEFFKFYDTAARNMAQQEIWWSKKYGAANNAPYYHNFISI